jgi:hypothetical protein
VRIRNEVQYIARDGPRWLARLYNETLNRQTDAKP